MGTKKQKSTKPAPAASSDVQTVGEKYCPPCQGMVNGNGCAKADCPVRPN